MCVTTPWGLLYSTRILQGFKNASQIFQGIINNVLSELGLLYNGVLSYSDDCLSHADDPAQLFDIWSKLLPALLARGFRLDYKKVQLSFVGRR